MKIHKWNSWIMLLGLPLLLSCSNQTSMSTSNNKTADIATSDQTQIISCPIVEKSFIKKNGATTDHKELYLQRSIQDYFIKFCASKVSRAELEKHLSKQDGLIKTATLEVEFLEGEWDICDGNQNQQSRIGSYAIIHRIIKE